MGQVTAASRGMVLSFVVLAGCAATGPAGRDRIGPATGMEPTAPGERFPVLARVGGCKVVEREGRLVLSGPTGDRSLVQTSKEYRPPFVLRLRAMTDTTNIRLYYNAGMVILNWEVRPSELRYHDPVSDRIMPFRGAGAIETGKMHDIAWEVYPDGTRLLVDGKEVMRKQGEYGDVSAPVGIGPSFGSVVTVESLTVDAIEGTLEDTR